MPWYDIKIKWNCPWKKERRPPVSRKKERGTDTFTPCKSVLGISHINIVVNDIDIATNFYKDVLGFEPATNSVGAMDYRNVQSNSFARNAGFLDAKIKLDIRFLKHPEVGIYIELVKYYSPAGDCHIPIKHPHDLGGIRHLAFIVENASLAYEFIREKKKFYVKQGLNISIIGEDHPPERMTPLPYKFFYWVDPWGVQWEMEEGRCIEKTIKGITG